MSGTHRRDDAVHLPDRIGQWGSLGVEHWSVVAGHRNNFSDPELDAD